MSNNSKRDQEVLQAALKDLDHWTTQQIVAQLIMPSVGHDVQDRSFGAGGTDVTPDKLQEAGFGGLCYFPGDPAGSTPQIISRRVETYQKVAALPLLVSIDQENGLVTRMREPATRIASAMAQVAAGDWDEVANMAAISGKELRAAGVNLAFSPIADVNDEPDNPVIGLRSPGSSPQIVADFDRLVIEGLRQSDVASCAKHFPGHGCTHVDSHVGLPVLDITREEWEETEAVPFQASIDAGVDAVMVGHLSAPNLDPTNTPAVYSKPIVTGLLRGELGFEGVIVTDALDMQGARLEGGPGEGVIAAFAAGADIALMPTDPLRALEEVCEAVDEGRLQLDALRDSARRVLELKLRLATYEEPAEAFDRLEGDASSRRQAFKQIRRSLTWRDPDVDWNLPPVPVSALIIQDRGGVDEDRGTVDVARGLAKHMRDGGYEAEVIELEDGQTSVPIDANGDPYDAVILVTRDAWRRQSDAAVARALSQKVDCVVCARSPYDSALIHESKPVLLAFGDLPQVPQALYEALLTGEATGKLPVDLLDSEGSVRWRRRVHP